MQPPFGAHCSPRAQQPRPCPHQWPPFGQYDCACACAETNSAPATTTAVNTVLRNIARLPPAFGIRFVLLDITRLDGAPDRHDAQVTRTCWISTLPPSENLPRGSRPVNPQIPLRRLHSRPGNLPQVARYHLPGHDLAQ